MVIKKRRRYIYGTNRLWSEAVLDAPGLVLHRLSSSKGRLSWLNISGAPVYHVNINICVFFIFVSISLSLHCLCRFLYICLCLNISTIELTWLFWKCADVTGKLNSRLWTSGAFPAKSNIRFFRIFRAQQFSFSILD